MKAEESINANKVVKGMTMDIKITGMKTLAVKLKIGLWLIKMGCRVIGCKCKIKTRKGQ